MWSLTSPVQQAGMHPSTEKPTGKIRVDRGIGRGRPGGDIGRLSGVSFKVKLLGSFGLLRNDVLMAPPDWGIRTTRQLLKHLAARAGQVVPDDLLLDSLWPDADVGMARRSLRVRVSELRRLFAETGHADVVQRVAEGYRFQPVAGVVEVDVDDFEKAAKAALGAVDDDEIVALAQAARRLYTGDFLGDDMYGDQWIPERDRLRALWHAVSERLADAWAERSDYDAAAEVIRSILSPSDPQEHLYRTLMLLHYNAGRQTEALRVFEQCQSALESLFGVQPMPETLQLLESIIRQRPATDRASAGPSVPSSASAMPSASRPRRRGRSAYPFLGRAAEAGRLREAAAALEAGHGRIVWISGESGMGKSRLLEEVFQTGAADLPTHRSLFMRGHGMAHAVSFSTLLDGLQQGMDDVPDDIFAKAGGLARGQGEGTATAQLLADLLGRDDRFLKSSPSMGTEPLALQGTWLRQKLLQLLQTLAEHQPLIVAVDNADDADEATWGVLVAAARVLSEHAFLLVVASRFRPEETEYGKALTEAASEAEHIELKPLAPTDLRPLAAEASLTAQTRRWLEYLYDQSDGDPLAITELLRWMEQSGFVTWSGEGFTVHPREQTQMIFSAPPRLSVAETLRTRWGARMDRLSSTARRLLVQTAVLGDSLSQDRLQLLSRLDGDDFVAALEELFAVGFVAEVRTAAATGIRLAHARLQNYVYHQAPIGHRRWLHREAARLIEEEIRSDSVQGALPFRRSPSMMAMEIAYHSEAAGDVEHACRWSLGAAEAVADRVGSTQAVTLYRHAFALAKKLAPNNRWMRQARRGLGHSLFEAYQFAEAIPHLEQEVAVSAFTSVADFETASRLALAYMQFHQAEQAAGVANRLLEQAERVNDPNVKGGVLLTVSFLSYRLGDAPKAKKQARKAIALLKRVDPSEGRLRLAYRRLSLYCWDMSEYGSAIEYARLAVAESRLHGDNFELIRALNQLGELYQDLFCVRSAQPLHEEALQLAAEGDHALLTSEVWRNVGMNFLYKHNFDRAFHTLERAWQHMIDLDASPYWKEIALRALIEAHLLSGDVERVTELLPVYKQVAGPRESAFVAVFRAALALLRGEWGEFASIFADMEQFWSRTSRRAREHHVLFFAGRTLIASGAAGQGGDLLRRGLAGLERIREQLPDGLEKEMVASRPVQEVRETLESIGDDDWTTFDWFTA